MDRNRADLSRADLSGASLSARRAWIEICVTDSGAFVFLPVALRKESVDRNAGSVLNA